MDENIKEVDLLESTLQSKLVNYDELKDALSEKRYLGLRKRALTKITKIITEISNNDLRRLQRNDNWNVDYEKSNKDINYIVLTIKDSAHFRCVFVIYQSKIYFVKFGPPADLGGDRHVKRKLAAFDFISNLENGNYEKRKQLKR